MALEQTQRRVAYAFHHVDLKGGHTIELVACDDQSMGIVFDGDLVPTIWSPKEAESCIDVYANFVFLHGGSLEGEANPLH